MSDSPRADGGRPVRNFDMRQLAGSRWPVPAWHLERIEAEMACDAPKQRMLSVVKRMARQTAPGFEAAGFEAVESREVAAPLWSVVARRAAGA